MSEYTQDRIKYKIIWYKIEVIVIKDEKERYSMRWFSYVQLRRTDTTMIKIDCLNIVGTSSGKKEDLKRFGQKQFK